MIARSVESRQKASETMKRKFEDPEYRRWWSERHKGHKVSGETKRKISMALKGKPKSEEVRRKESEAKKRLWADSKYRNMMKESFKGRKHTEEWKKHHSEVIKKKWQDPEYRRKVLEKIQSPEFRKKLSEKMRGRYTGDKNPMKRPEVARKISDALKGRPKSEEHKRKVAEANRKNWENPEFRERMMSRRNYDYMRGGNNPMKKPDVARKVAEHCSVTMKKKWADPKYRKKTIENRDFYKSEEWRRKNSEARKKLWANPEFREKIMENIYRCYGTSIELKVKEILDKMGVKYRYQSTPDGALRGTKRAYHHFDFVIPDKRIVLEVNGDYWHGNPEVYPNLSERQEKQRERDMELKRLVEERGWRYVEIWEKDIKEGREEEILKEVLA